jgi:uncharacterized protein (DUF1330 family)
MLRNAASAAALAQREKSMAKGYWIFHTTVNDAETYREYVERDGEAFARYGARFLVRGGRFEAVEGGARQRHVIIEFESYDRALDCYRSAEYQAALAFRRISADSDLVIIEGAD